MKIDILTAFPAMFTPFAESMVKRAQEKGKVYIHIHNLRDWTSDTYQSIDDHPYGGGAGMVLMVEPIYKALQDIDPGWKAFRILFTARGARIMQEKVRELSKKEHLVLICGHYEGTDERVHEHLVNVCLSLGDFILTGGEIPAMALTDAVVRLIPGVLGNKQSVVDESFSESSKNYLEYPHYAKPAAFKTKKGEIWKVPSVLLSGNHAEIKKWRENNKKLSK
jgi:tRNA (guanine37-N1)-methyltransferase